MLGKTRREMIALLKHQIQLEGKDKVFLLRMYQEISKDIVGGLPPPKPLTTSPEARPDPSPNPSKYRYRPHASLFEGQATFALKVFMK